MDAPLVIVTAGEAETHEVGRLLAGLTMPDDVIALAGGLGAGKTALVQGLAEGLGVEGRVPSPTFNLLLVHPGVRTLYHFDLYRLEHARQLEDIDFYETLERGGVSAIEWADRFWAEMPPERLDVGIDVLDESRRRLELTPRGGRAETLAHAWRDAWERR
jgi:tRNA threonylcarbamoyladenosine biosynthesis protein TsaE